ncbi:MAG: succinate dehydrogenase, cytochrome b556 subunit [Phenylobacterium sp.]|jgi:succinate dehydrogenase / fumarate reductase cytochrome b subunit|uniref:succinate dehydrogenase, cytochrome b556 subunit n=1 Tax=Phenylobacterium sp. TaxID=1871053 RepID=UPI002A35B16F|nr:succinate dehydrogenase, cytochrome b556 subunit [Phenylobacterium sp.]MDX9996552.1 succinate dehydrogenase, cytochrome b556 subunit [Phenylobacterium sp.]
MTDATRGPRERPLSPHVQVWRWHVTMATSILHRVSGVGLYVGALILAGWAVSLARGPEAYAGFKAALGSPIGQVILFLLTAAVFYHLANGIRHLVWDTGRGFGLKSANSSAWFVLFFTAAATLVLWGAYLMGMI